MELNTSAQLVTVAGHNIPYLLVGDAKGIWFQAKPLAELLEYSDTTSAIRVNVRESHRQEYQHLIQTHGVGKVDSGEVASGYTIRWQPMTVFVDAYGLVDLLQKASLSASQRFTDWMTERAIADGTAEFLMNLQEMTAARPRISHGVVYVITSPLLAAVKIGRWSGSLEALASRYKTTMGPEVEMHVCKASNCHKAEQLLLQQFADQNISGELFSKDSMQDYIKQMQAICSSEESSGQHGTKRKSTTLPYHVKKQPAYNPAYDEASCFRTASEIYKDIIGEKDSKQDMMYFGKEMAKEYRGHHDGMDPPRVEKLIDGCQRKVNAYSTEDDAWIVPYVQDCMKMMY